MNGYKKVGVMAALVGALYFSVQTAAAQCNVPQQQSVSSAAILQQQAALQQLNAQLAAQNQRTAVAMASAAPLAQPQFLAITPPVASRSAIATSSVNVPPPPVALATVPLAVPLATAPVATATATSSGNATARSGGGFHPFQNLRRPRTVTTARTVTRG